MTWAESTFRAFHEDMLSIYKTAQGASCAFDMLANALKIGSTVVNTDSAAVKRYPIFRIGTNVKPGISFPLFLRKLENAFNTDISRVVSGIGEMNGYTPHTISYPSSIQDEQGTETYVMGDTIKEDVIFETNFPNHYPSVSKLDRKYEEYKAAIKSHLRDSGFHEENISGHPRATFTTDTYMVFLEKLKLNSARSDVYTLRLRVFFFEEE